MINNEQKLYQSFPRTMALYCLGYPLEGTENYIGRVELSFHDKPYFEQSKRLRCGHCICLITSSFKFTPATGQGLDAYSLISHWLC